MQAVGSLLGKATRTPHEPRHTLQATREAQRTMRSHLTRAYQARKAPRHLLLWRIHWGFFAMTTASWFWFHANSGVIVRVFTSSPSRAVLAMIFQATGNVRLSVLPCHSDHTMTHRSKNAPYTFQALSSPGNVGTMPAMYRLVETMH